MKKQLCSKSFISSILLTILSLSSYANAEVNPASLDSAQVKPACYKQYDDLKKDYLVMSRHDRMLLEQMRERYRNVIQGMNLEVDAAVAAVKSWLSSRPDIVELSRWSLLPRQANSVMGRNNETLEMDAILNENIPTVLFRSGFTEHQIICNKGLEKAAIVPEVCFSMPTGLGSRSSLAESIRSGKISNRLYLNNLMRADITGRSLKLPLSEVNHAQLIVNNEFPEFLDSPADDLRPNEIAFYYTLQTKPEMTQLPRTIVNEFNFVNSPFYFEYKSAIRFLNLTTGAVRISKALNRDFTPIFSSNPDLGSGRIYSQGYTRQRWKIEAEMDLLTSNCK